MTDDQQAPDQLTRDLIAANKQLLRNLAFRDLLIVWLDAGDGKREEYEELIAAMMTRKSMEVYTRPH